MYYDVEPRDGAMDRFPPGRLMRAQGLASTASNLSCASGDDWSREGNSTCAFSTGASHPKILRYRRFWVCVSLFAAFLWASRRLLWHRGVQKGQIVVPAQRPSQQTLLWLAKPKRSCAHWESNCHSQGQSPPFYHLNKRLRSACTGRCVLASCLLLFCCCICWRLFSLSGAFQQCLCLATAMGSARQQQDHKFQPFNDEPGEAFRKFRRNLLSYAAGKVDESGSSVSDYLLDIDMGGGGVGAPAIPNNPASDFAKMTRLRNGRTRLAYGLIYDHCVSENTKSILYATCFQNGRAALQYLEGLYDTPVMLSDLREMDRRWQELSIVQDVGVREDSITQLVVLMQRVNGERPVANRFTNEQLAEKLLEAIRDSSKHFSEGALTEYNALPGSRRFEHQPGHPQAGERDFLALERYYTQQWRAAVRNKYLTRMEPQRAGARQPPRQNVDDGLGAFVDGRLADHPTLGPRDVNPNLTLGTLEAVGFDVRRDTTTTTDFEEVGANDLALAVRGACEDFSLEQCFDADDQSTVEIVCNNCRGLGHPKRLCPSTVRFRSFSYAIAMLQSGMSRADARAQADGAPRGGRRPPPRGQRPPFRSQPRRFQPTARRPLPPPRRDAAAAAEHEEPLPLAPADEPTGVPEARVGALAPAALPVAEGVQPLVFDDDPSLFPDERVETASAAVTVAAADAAM